MRAADGEEVHTTHIHEDDNTLKKVTYEVDRSEAPMADLPQVREELLGVLPEEKLGHLRVLQAPGPHTRGHGQRLASVEEGHSVIVDYWKGSKTPAALEMWSPV